MVVLIKVKASTLIETLVATVLIIIIFIISSMILNNIYLSSIINDTRAINAQLNELQYLNLNGKLELPYRDTFSNWNIKVEKYIESNQTLIEFEANNILTTKTIILKQYESN
ncbi:hypothetical protein [Olleya sp.]|jgi:predicted PurR-regulated permease PerM|uniref:hypothetical protein n=1 Tax=Olleya sp. TaxID=1906788 RepID=UPI0032D8C22D